MFRERERNFDMPDKRSLNATTHTESVNVRYMNSRGKYALKISGNSLNFYTFVFLLHGFSLES